MEVFNKESFQDCASDSSAAAQESIVVSPLLNKGACHIRSRLFIPNCQIGCELLHIKLYI